jgi:hypothetical protein
MAEVDSNVVYMLTTVDNPYNPFDEWDAWLVYDEAHGYNTSGLLARIAFTSDELSEADQALSIRQAIDEVVRENVSGLHRKVSRDFFSST